MHVVHGDANNQRIAIGGRDGMARDINDVAKKDDKKNSKEREINQSMNQSKSENNTEHHTIHAHRHDTQDITNTWDLLARECGWVV